MKAKNLLMAALLVALVLGLAGGALAKGADTRKDAKGNLITYRFFIAAQGQGDVNCNGYRTDLGHDDLWLPIGTKAKCSATPKDGYQFKHWNENGNLIGSTNPFKYGRIGAKLTGVFKPAK